VIGESFPEDQLLEITGLSEADLREALRALASAEFVYDTAAYPRVEYAFKHAQTRDVAYDSQLQDARARTHAAIARSIESLRAEHMEENYALLAHHWERAREPLAAAAWSLRAAGWARHSDAAEAVRHYRRVLELVGEATGDGELQKLVLGACIGVLKSGTGTGLEEGEPRRVLESGRAAAAALDSRRQLVELLMAYSHGEGATAGYVPVVEAREALRLAEEIGDLRLLGRSRVTLAQLLWSQEREFRAALELLEAALADDPTNWRVLALHGRLLAETGRLDDAQADLDRASEFLSRFSLARWLELEPRRATLEVRRGNFETANRRAARCLEQGERHKNRFFVVQALLTLGECCTAAGRYREAIDHLERTREHSQSFNVAPWAQSLLRPHLILAFIRVGERDRARELLEICRAQGSPSHPESRAKLAQAMIELSGPEELSGAGAYLDEIERLTVEEGTHYYRAPHQECRAALARRREDEDGRLHHLREAQRLYTEMGATGHAERLARELGC
jgi:adenylate cyclase